MKHEPIDILSIELADSGVEELDLSEGAMYKRAFKKFYFKEKQKTMNETDGDDDYRKDDCEDIEDEDLDLNIEDDDIEIEEEDIP